MDIFQKIPLPNWNVRYEGLKDIPFIKKYFKSINLSHAYRSSYNIGSYISNDIETIVSGFGMVKDSLQNYISQYEINSVSINEQFSPLINIDMTMVNNLTARFEMKKSRTVTLSFANNQITEVFSNEYGL